MSTTTTFMDGTKVDLPSLAYLINTEALLLATDGILYGLYAALMIWSLVIHWRKGTRSKTSAILLGLTILLFVGTTLKFWATFALVKRFNAALRLFGQASFEGMFKEVRLSQRRWLRGDLWLMVFNFVVSDAILVWRAYVLSLKCRKTLIAPMIFLLGVFVTGLVQASLGPDPTISSTIWRSAHVVSSFLTNVSATGIMFWNSRWMYRVSLSVNPEVRHMSPSFNSSRALLLLVESGIVYCLLQAGLVAVFFAYMANPRNMTAWRVLRPYYDIVTMISAIYPTAIIVVVANRSSVTDGGRGAIENIPNASQHTLVDDEEKVVGRGNSKSAE